jgi:hypothetical protein
MSALTTQGASRICFDSFVRFVSIGKEEVTEDLVEDKNLQFRNAILEVGERATACRKEISALNWTLLSRESICAAAAYCFSIEHLFPALITGAAASSSLFIQRTEALRDYRAAQKELVELLNKKVRYQRGKVRDEDSDLWDEFGSHVTNELVYRGKKKHHDAWKKHVVEYCPLHDQQLFEEIGNCGYALYSLSEKIATL